MRQQSETVDEHSEVTVNCARCLIIGGPGLGFCSDGGDSYSVFHTFTHLTGGRNDCTQACKIFLHCAGMLCFAFYAFSQIAH